MVNHLDALTNLFDSFTEDLSCHKEQQQQQQQQQQHQKNTSKNRCGGDNFNEAAEESSNRCYGDVGKEGCNSPNNPNNNCPLFYREEKRRTIVPTGVLAPRKAQIATTITMRIVMRTVTRIGMYGLSNI